jgi:preprotein translocase SecE subunit
MADNTRTSPRDFASEVVEQVKKVTWPDRAQLQSSTGIIVAFMLAMALVIFGIDAVVRTVLDAVSSLFSS